MSITFHSYNATIQLCIICLHAKESVARFSDCSGTTLIHSNVYIGRAKARADFIDVDRFLTACNLFVQRAIKLRSVNNVSNISRTVNDSSVVLDVDGWQMLECRIIVTKRKALVRARIVLNMTAFASVGYQRTKANSRMIG